MKIVKCPNCSKCFVVENTEMWVNCTEIIECPYCSFFDYAYSFNGKGIHRHSNSSFDIDEIIDVFLQYLPEIKERKLDISALIFDMHKKCEVLSPIVICEVLNSLLEDSKDLDERWKNDSLFCLFKCKTVSLEEIKQNNDNIESEMREIISRIRDDTDEIELLKRKIKSLEFENAKLESEYVKIYNLLREKLY